MPAGLRDALAGRYTIEREIGRGGMAVVYLAQDLRHQRPVALKLLLPDPALAFGPERFQREIHFAARLQHPHILTVLDSGEVPAGGAAAEAGAGAPLLWFTMPFVEGESLRDRIQREGTLPLEDALRITTEAARALDHAHRQGVIHRDIKPGNILLTRDGTTLVADFGIARGLGTEDGLTRTGVSVGTPAYMSPEQVDGEELDPRSDQYSLATVCYEMLTGRPPFTGRTIHAIVASRLSEPTPSVRTLRDAIPVPVDEAIRKAMAPAPADRFASVGEFARALQGTAGQTGPTDSGATTLPASGAAPSLAGAGAQAATGTTPGGARPALRAGGLLIVAVLVGGLALGWYLLAGRHTAEGRVVAVLPFDNLGDSADAYFADGVADEVRAKLAQLPGLEVIARGSSTEYRGSTRRPEEIARELGAGFLLTGTVRWERAAAGATRVRVTPELVEVRAGQAGRTRWTRQFDASLSDVFQVQADIAARVANALGVVLGDSARRGLESRPTGNLAAYDEFLKGEAAAHDMRGDQADLRRAIGYYQRAVAIDSAFALAWSQLSRAQSSLYSNGVPDPALGEAARTAAERARRLRPDEPRVYLALGDYHQSVLPVDNARALAEYERGLRLAPNDADLLSAAASQEASLGRWVTAAARLARASQLDPRSVAAARRQGTVNLFLRNYPLADSAYDRALALAPTNPAIIELKVMVALARGEMGRAQQLVAEATRQVEPERLLPFLASYQDLYWVLTDEQQRQVLTLPPSAFDDDRAAWAMVRAELYHLRGDTVRTRVYADTARMEFMSQLRQAPEDGQRRVLLGLSLAYLGRRVEAEREGLRAHALVPISGDGYQGPYVQLQLVRIYILSGEPEKALDQLEPLLRIPYYLSPGWLRLDPTFAPLREDPRFRRLAGPPVDGIGS